MSERTYQSNAVALAVKAINQGLSAIVVLPTGSGKTYVGRDVLSQIRDRKVLWLAHRQELLTSAKKIISEPVDFRSVQQGVNAEKTYDLIVTDEAHRSPAPSYKAFYDFYPSAVRLGFSATPERLDGLSLSGCFDIMIQPEGATVSRLIDDGWLSPITFYAPNPSDGLLGNDTRRALPEYKKYCDGLRGVVFCASNAEAEEVRDLYSKSGIAAVALSDKTSPLVRQRIFADWIDGRISVIVNCELFVEGIDLPNVEFVQILRRTNSRRMYFQMIGRGMRPDCPCRVLDHTDNWDRLGLPTDDIIYGLDTQNPATGTKSRMIRTASGLLVPTGEKTGVYKSAALVKIEEWAGKQQAAIEMKRADPATTTTAVASVLGVSSGTVNKWWRLANLEISTRQYAADVQQVAIEMKRAEPSLTTNLAAKRLGVSRDTVLKWWRAAGIAVASQDLDPEMIEQIISLKRDNPNISSTKAANQIGVSSATILKHWAKAGYESRSQKMRRVKLEILDLRSKNPEILIVDLSKRFNVGTDTIAKWLKGQNNKGRAIAAEIRAEIIAAKAANPAETQKNFRKDLASALPLFAKS